MNSEAEITEYIAQNLPGVAAVSAPGGTFFFYDPNGDVPAERRFPFATVIINDDYDSASQLSRPGIFRLNIGVSKETCRTMFGELPTTLGPNGIIETDHDFTALDFLMPHPVYAAQCWVSVLNPDEVTLEEVKRLLDEAYEIAVRKYKKLSAKNDDE
ncbi:MAG: DUF6194 family protein [Burkholderiales bacterium]